MLDSTLLLLWDLQRRRKKQITISRETEDGTPVPIASSEALLSVIPVESMHIEQASHKAEAKGSDVARAEIELFLSYLVFQSVFIRNQQELSKAQKWVQEYVTKSQTYNRRTLDLLTAKFFFWQAKLAEDSDTLESLRPSYTNALRTATVRQDTETQVPQFFCLSSRLLVRPHY